MVQRASTQVLYPVRHQLDWFGADIPEFCRWTGRRANSRSKRQCGSLMKLLQDRQHNLTDSSLNLSDYVACVYRLCGLFDLDQLLQRILPIFPGTGSTQWYMPRLDVQYSPCYCRTLFSCAPRSSLGYCDGGSCTWWSDFPDCTQQAA